MKTETGDIAEFLKTITPFQSLDEPTLIEIAAGATTETYPKGSLILEQEGPPSDCLRIIKQGNVKVFMKTRDNEEVVVDYRGEGDAFGLLSVVGGDKSRANVVAVEDTVCHGITKETILRLVDSHSAFAEFFLKSFFNRFIDKAYTELHGKSMLYGGSDKILFSTILGDLLTREVVTAPQDVTIQKAAEIMSRNSISSLILVDPADGVPAGIITDRDLRDKVIARARSVTDPASSVMSISLIKADAHDYCFEALLKMIHYNIHHLLVVDQGKLKGVVTNHDFLMLQGTSPLSIAREIDHQQTIEGLIPASKRINKVIDLLVREGARASNITRVITEINDRLVKRLIEITEARLGPPPVNYCWIAFGSEGRKEQTFRTDQDNAIIYEDPSSEEKAREAERYFSHFSLHMRDSLVKCGFPPCSADYMAGNPRWRQPLSVWKNYFASWIKDPTPETVLLSLIFFDFRPVYGNATLAQKLRAALRRSIKGQKLFFVTMASIVVQSAPPLGFFGNFVVQRRGEHKNELNIKQQGIALIVDLARLFALETGIDTTSTLDRLRELREKHPYVKDFGEELEQAFEFLTALRLRCQLDKIHWGGEPDNFVNPAALSGLERNTLKESFKLIARVHDTVIDKYKPLIVARL